MNKNSDFLVDEIRNILKSTLNPCYENTAKTEIYCRCPICGDSKKDKRKARFYIQMKPPFHCYCQNCGFTGFLDQEMLNKLQIFNNDVAVDILEANKTIERNSNIHVQRKRNKFNYKDDPDDLSVINSLNYINSRFNSNFSVEELNNKFKCVCNPYEYLKSVDPEFEKRKTKFDYSQSIGFVSSDNKYLICRDITGKQTIRYSNTSLSKDDDKSKIYNIRTKIDLTKDKIKLVITEGIFDAIGIYLKKYKDAENVIISAGCGKSFSQVINKFIEMGFLNLDIEIYSDTDVDISFYKELKRKSMYISDNQLSIFYNTLEKDCGVNPDKINLRKVVI